MKALSQDAHGINLGKKWLFFTIVRVATPSETPPHSQEPPEISLYATLSSVSQESPLPPDPFNIPAGASCGYPQHPNI